MEHILLVSGSVDGKEILSQLIRDMGYNSMTKTQSGNEARRLACQTEYDLIIVNTPLSDEFGRDFALKISETTNSAIILICRQDIFEDLSDKLSSSGIFVVSKPLNKTAFVQTVNLAMSTRSRMLGLESNKKIQSKTEEIKLINRAKNCLMQYLKFTEPQAHRYIEKQAMDRCISKREIAEEIIKTYS